MLCENWQMEGPVFVQGPANHYRILSENVIADGDAAFGEFLLILFQNLPAFYSETQTDSVIDIIYPSEHKGIYGTIKLIVKTVIQIWIIFIELVAALRRILHLYLHHPGKWIIGIFDVFYFHWFIL